MSALRAQGESKDLVRRYARAAAPDADLSIQRKPVRLWRAARNEAVLFSFGAIRGFDCSRNSARYSSNSLYGQRALASATPNKKEAGT